MQNPGPVEDSPPPSRSGRRRERQRRRAERMYGSLFVLTALVVMGDLVAGGPLWHAALKLFHRMP